MLNFFKKKQGDNQEYAVLIQKIDALTNAIKDLGNKEPDEIKVDVAPPQVEVASPTVNMELPVNQPLVTAINKLVDSINSERDVYASVTDDTFQTILERDKKWQKETDGQFQKLREFVDLYRNDLSELKKVLANLEGAMVKVSKIDFGGETKIIGQTREQDQIDRDLIKGAISFLKNHTDNYEFSFDPDELYPRTISHSGVLRIDTESGQIVAPFEPVMTSDERTEIMGLIQPYIQNRKTLLVKTIKDA